jgi:hypothetical protein
MEVSTVRQLVSLTVELTTHEAVCLYDEIQLTFDHDPKVSGPDSASKAYPLLFELYQELYHAYVRDVKGDKIVTDS